jgi:hypothetical protein
VTIRRNDGFKNKSINVPFWHLFLKSEAIGS